MGERLGLSVWCCDQAGPFETIPCAGTRWQPEGEPAHHPHEYIGNGTAKVLTRLHPQDGEVPLKGVTSCTNEILHGWLQQELSAILQEMPAEPIESEQATASEPTGAAALHSVALAPSTLDAQTTLLAEQEELGALPSALRADWERWQEGLIAPPSLPENLPPLRLLLILDNLAGHKTVQFVLWLFAHGIMPLYTPLGGSWLNRAESIQRILKRRALEGEHPSTPEQIIAWFEAAARGWNRAPTPFEWGGKRAARRQRARELRHLLGGSGAFTRVPIRLWKMAA